MNIVSCAQLTVLFIMGCWRSSPRETHSYQVAQPEHPTPVMKTQDQWRSELTSEEFQVLRQGGTERAFSSELWDNHETGVYQCAGCGLELFSSESKFDSGTGWPSFSQPVHLDSVMTRSDTTAGMPRVEVLCNRCGGHLGHVFGDGPLPTGQRYCVNGDALDFLSQ